jgi:transposase-like protein
VVDAEKLPKWKLLNGEERYRVVELARKGKVGISDLCRTFGVSRQTLYRALEAADRASVEALTPKRRGRKPPPASKQKLAEIEAQKAKLEKELRRMSQRYEVAQALLDLQRKAERGERLPGEKKTLRANRRANPTSTPSAGTKTPLAGGHDGERPGRETDGTASLDPSPGVRESGRASRSSGGHRPPDA